MERSSNLIVRTKGDGRRTAVPAGAGEEATQWGRTAATTGLRRRALVLRDAEGGQEANSATGFVAERRGRGGGLAGASWGIWPSRRRGIEGGNSAKSSSASSAGVVGSYIGAGLGVQGVKGT